MAADAAARNINSGRLLRKPVPVFRQVRLSIG